MARAPLIPADPEVERYLGGVGKHVKALRELKGLSQEESARQAGIPVGGLRDIEQGYDTRLSHHYLNAKHLELPFGYGFSEGLNAEVKDMVCKLSVSSAQTLHELSKQVGQLGEKVGQLEEAMVLHANRITRRTFNASSPLALLSAAFPEPIHGLLAEPGFPPLSVEKVELMHAHCDDLDLRYRALGSGAVFQLTMDLHDRALSWFRDGSYPEKVKHALGALCAQLKSWVGWFAYDMEQLALAERFLHEAVTYARIARSPQVEIHALDNLCALLMRKGQHEQALHTAEAGLVVTPAQASRTRSVFHMRRLRACAYRGDHQGLLREAEAAQLELDRGPAQGDRDWTDWGERAVVSVTGRAHVDLGEGAKGEALLRTVDEPCRYQELLTNIYLGHALVQQGALSQASTHAAAILPDVVVFESDRIQRKFHELYSALYPQRSEPSVRDFIYAYDEAVGRHT